MEKGHPSNMFTRLFSAWIIEFLLMATELAYFFFDLPKIFDRSSIMMSGEAVTSPLIEKLARYLA